MGAIALRIFDLPLVKFLKSFLARKKLCLRINILRNNNVIFGRVILRNSAHQQYQKRKTGSSSTMALFGALCHICYCKTKCKWVSHKSLEIDE